MLFSEPKIPQLRLRNRLAIAREGFSALQRAENSSIVTEDDRQRRLHLFQCSSASRKFLNSLLRSPSAGPRSRFSALQRAENSSIYLTPVAVSLAERVSVLFSEPKIPQSAEPRTMLRNVYVSVLFSEPKIPQSTAWNLKRALSKFGFSALQRAENSSISGSRCGCSACGSSFSALQRAENSSIWVSTTSVASVRSVSVLFSEPKIPQSERPRAASTPASPMFQCSSASRKFLNQ